MRVLSYLLCVVVATGCYSKAGIVAKVKDPSRVVVRLGGERGLEMRGGPGPDERVFVGRYNNYDVVFIKRWGSLEMLGLPPKIFLTGNMMGPFQPPLTKLWKPGKKTFGITSSVRTFFDSRYRFDAITNTRVYESRSERLPYTVSTEIDNVEYFEEKDIPDRTMAGVLLGVGLGLALGGYYMTTRDSWYVKYPGYVVAVSGTFNFVFGAVNTVRPKRPTKYTRTDGTVTTVAPSTERPSNEGPDATHTPGRR